eukprot:3323086-Rhodomonas_salina.4
MVWQRSESANLSRKSSCLLSVLGLLQKHVLLADDNNIKAPQSTSAPETIRVIEGEQAYSNSRWGASLVAPPAEKALLSLGTGCCRNAEQDQGLSWCGRLDAGTKAGLRASRACLHLQSISIKRLDAEGCMSMSVIVLQGINARKRSTCRCDRFQKLGREILQESIDRSLGYLQSCRKLMMRRPRCRCSQERQEQRRTKRER